MDNKVDYSKIFNKRKNGKEIKDEALKEGWIKLSKKGTISNYRENEEKKEKIMNENVKKIYKRHQTYKNDRIKLYGYISEESLKSSDKSSENSEETEDDLDEDTKNELIDMEAEKYDENKYRWYTS